MASWPPGHPCTSTSALIHQEQLKQLIRLKETVAGLHRGIIQTVLANPENVPVWDACLITRPAQREACLCRM
jgi:hypothetical protein